MLRGRTVLCMLIVCFMLLTCFTGCKTGISGVPEETTSVSLTEKTSGESLEETVKEQEPLKFEIAMSHANSKYVLKTDDWENEKWLKAFNEKFNTDMTIRWIDHEKQAEFYALMFSSGDIPDIVATDGVPCIDPVLCGSVEAGKYHALDDIIDENRDKLQNILGMLTKTNFEFTSYDGKIYGFPGQFRMCGVSARATYIRMDLIEKYGLEVPETVDEFIDVLRVFKENGMRYPYSGRQNFDYTDIFFCAYGVSNWNDNWGVHDGKLMPTLVMPGMKDALTVLRQLYEEGLMDPETFTNTGNDLKAKIYSGEVGLFNQNASSFAGYNSGLQQNVPDGRLALIPSPRGPEGHGGMPYASPNTKVYYINKDFENPLGFLLLLEKISTDESQNFFAYGIEGEDYTIGSDGKVQWEYPTDPDVIDALTYRNNRINLFRDYTYDRKILPFREGAKEIIDWITNIAPYEGMENYKILVPIEAYEKYPDIQSPLLLFNEYAIQIVRGELPIDAFDDFVNDYYERGGEEVINEATEKMKAGLAVLLANN